VKASPRRGRLGLAQTSEPTATMLACDRESAGEDTSLNASTPSQMLHDSARAPSKLAVRAMPLAAITSTTTAANRPNRARRDDRHRALRDAFEQHAEPSEPRDRRDGMHELDAPRARASARPRDRAA